MNETITSEEDFETIQGQPWYQYLSWQFPAMVGNVALEEWIKARVSDSRLISAVVKRCDAQSATLERLTNQQAEDAQAHKAEVERLTSERDESQSALAVIIQERESFQKFVDSLPHEDRPILVGPIQIARWTIAALARQIDELTKDKAKRHIIGTVLIDRSTGEVLDTPPDTTTSAMKGETHE